MERKYLVCIEQEDYFYWKIMSAHELFSHMDMADCMDMYVKHIHLLTERGPEVCKFYDVWSSLSEPFEPLRMEIRNAKGELLDYGYGSDH